MSIGPPPTKKLCQSKLTFAKHRKSSITDLQLLEQKISSNGLSVVDVPADGNCMFSAIANQLSILDVKVNATDTNITAEAVRQQLVEFLRWLRSSPENVSEKWSRITQRMQEAIPEKCSSVDDYLTKMSENDTWGDGTMLMVASLCYQRQVIIYYPQAELKCSRLSETFSDAGAIRLGFVGTNHYVSVIPSTETKSAGDQVVSTSNTPILEVRAHSQTPENCGDFTGVEEANKSTSSSSSSSLSDSSSQKPGQYSWAEFRSEQRGGSDRRRIVLCKVCVMYPDIVKLHNQRTPAICTMNGAVFRQQLVDEHAVSTYHVACVKRSQQERALAEGRVNDGETELEKSVRFANSELEKKVARLMIQVYMDAKRGTLSAWSFPARYVAFLMADKVRLNDEPQPFTPSDADLQYVTPHYHRQLLLTIAETDRISFGHHLQQALALSLRIDGAVDKQRIDNKHVMANYVTANGELKTVFLGLSESEERGSAGLFLALKEATEKCGLKWQDVFSKTTSIVTDGASENTGQHHSLWSTLSKERQSSEQADIPLMKIWCGVHRSQLAFKDMSVSVPEAAHIIADCKAVTSFYNASALRTKEIRNTAKDLGVNYAQFPSVNDIRFSEYSHKLLSAVLGNHKSMVTHLSSMDTAEVRGLRSKWLDADTVQVAAALCDATYVYKRFQKLLQGDKVTIFDVQIFRDHCVEELQKLLTRCLPGGYEEKLHVCTEASDISTFDGVALNSSAKRTTKRQHLFVTTKGRDVQAIRNEIILSLCNFLNNRLGTDRDAGRLTYASDFEAISPTYLTGGRTRHIDIERVYSGLVPDVDKKQFFSAYGEITAILQSSPRTTLQDILKLSLANKAWLPMSLALARVLAAKPHSCDVERLVSAYNILKDDDRCSLNARTIDAHLHVRVNMPVLSKFNVRPAVRAWFTNADRRNRDNSAKATMQPWFSDVF